MIVFLHNFTGTSAGSPKDCVRRQFSCDGVDARTSVLSHASKKTALLDRAMRQDSGSSPCCSRHVGRDDLRHRGSSVLSIVGISNSQRRFRSFHFGNYRERIFDDRRGCRRHRTWAAVATLSCTMPARGHAGSVAYRIAFCAYQFDSSPYDAFVWTGNAG